MSVNQKGKKDNAQTAQNKDVAPADADTSNSPTSDLSENSWSVISFDACAENGLTYDEAIKKMAKLSTERIPGLCIVTDEAASRISG